MAKRVAWCQERLNWTYEEWSRVIWTDESSFTTAGFGHRASVIRKAGEEFHPDCVDLTYHSGQSTTMAWGGFRGSKQSEFCLVPGKAKLDSAMYTDENLEPLVISFWHQMCKEYG